MGKYTASTKSPLAFKRMEQIQDILEEGPRTCTELLLEVSFNRMAMNAYLQKLLADGDVAIAPHHDGNGARVYVLPNKDCKSVRVNKQQPITIQRDWAVAALFGAA